jgi:amidase
MSELLSLSALEQARLIAARRISAEELVRHYADRVARLNPRLWAFVWHSVPAALRAARSKDRQARRGGPLPPFHGVPMGIKDLNLARFTPTRMGSRAYRWFWSPIDDVTTSALRRAGFIILGKTATSEFGALPVTEPGIHPPARNPWDPEVTPGGSSGGAAAAVAAGLLPIAQASDGGGSIRIPASFCHLYGFKPSVGLLPNPYARVDPLSIAYIGPIARTVADAAAMVDALRGGPPGEMTERLRRPPGRLRIRFTTRTSLCDTDPEVAAAVHRAAAALAELGHDVAEGPPLLGELAEYLPIWQRQVADVPVLREALLLPATRWMRAAGRAHRHADVRARHAGLRARVLAWSGEADLWLTPTVPVPPPAVGAWRGLSPEETFARAAQLCSFTAPFNLSGQPAASLPAGLSRRGLPIGVQLIGRPGDDGRVLAVSAQLEEARPWGGARPAIWG